MFRIATVAAAPALALQLTFGLCAQGTITDGQASYRQANVANSPTNDGGLANFTADPAAGDSTYQSWWYYNDNAGNVGAFNNSGGQLNQLYMGNSATLNWTDVDGLGIIDAVLLMTVSSTGPKSGRVVQVMSVANRTPLPLTIDLFHYVDFDHNNSTANWTLPASGPDRFIVTHANGGCVEHWAMNPTAFQVGPFAGVRSTCLMGGPLNNTGLPFRSAANPGDYTGAFQWTLTIPGNSTASVTTVMGHNDLQTGTPATQMHYGTGLGNMAGVVPMLTATNPTLGGDIRFDVTAGSLATNGVFAISGAPGMGGLCSLPFHVDLTTSFTASVTTMAGSGSVVLTAPCDPIFAGLPLFCQTFLVDATSTSSCLPLISSDGLRITLGD